MYELLKAIAAAENWIFKYARKDFQNLYNEVSNDGVPHLFLDPIEITDVYGDMNQIEAKNYSGAFIFVVSSDLDEIDYEYRYETYIKPLLVTHLKKITDSLRCNQNLNIDRIGTKEVINILDQNLDGLLVNFSVTIETE